MTPKPHSIEDDLSRIWVTLCTTNIGHLDDETFAAFKRIEEQLESLVTLVRVGFLVTVNGERATADTVANPELRNLLFSILQAKDTAAALASFPASRPTIEEQLAHDHRMGTTPE